MYQEVLVKRLSKTHVLGEQLSLYHNFHQQFHKTYKEWIQVI